MQPTTRTKAQLVNEYGVSKRTFYSWLKLINFYEAHPEAIQKSILTPKQVEYIYSKLDRP